MISGLGEVMKLPPIANLVSHVGDINGVCNADKHLALSFQPSKNHLAKKWLEYLSEIERPQTGPNAPYVRLLVDEIRRSVAAWKNDTTDEVIEGINTIWVGVSLLWQVLQPDAKTNLRQDLAA